MNKGRPLVSVIIPTKNEAKLLPGCLASLARQRTQVPYEIIVVDTDSADGTSRVARSCGAKVIREPRKGKVHAFRKGVSRAGGQILCFTEADCVVPPHWIEVICEHFEHHPEAAAVMGDYGFHSSTIFYNALSRVTHPILRWGWWLWFGHHSLRATNFAIRKDVYEKAGGFSQRTPELYDVDLSRRVAKVGKIHFLSSMRNQTSDRRVRGRFLRFVSEFIPTFWTVVIARKRLKQQTYQDIR